MLSVLRQQTVSWGGEFGGGSGGRKQCWRWQEEEMGLQYSSHCQETLHQYHHRLFEGQIKYELKIS